MPNSSDEINQEDMVSPPRDHRAYTDGELFKSPTSSISAESGIEMRYYSFRHNVRKDGRRKAILPLPDEDKNDTSVDSVFTESYVSSITSNSKQEYK